MLLEAVRSVRRQDYPGEVTILVVFDGTTPDEELRRQLGRYRAEVLTNARTDGLAGTRNTGILAAADDVVAFCDDDDTWDVTKLSRQIEAMQGRPDVQVVSCGMTVIFDGHETVRLAGRDWVTHAELCRSRMAMVHSSSLVFRRPFLVDLGMVDESAPGGQNEDWDLLLRSTRTGPVRMVDQPLIRVRWGRTSFFSQAYESKIEGLRWVLDRHPEIRQDPRGYARVLGQIAYWQACLKDPAARATAAHARSVHRTQWRAWLAPLVAAGVVPREAPLKLLHRIGRGV